ncbi:MAG: hypothetical protein H6738_01240 [Alphaproteobacteria bacterium]|nr:hypothetical protein [Alphaproteobacteria bacterium]MCB9695392.1 hypothetical protein [Alphaproteobacteria bacterium]
MFWWLFLFVSVARAQGLAGFLSPGPLAAPHAEIDGVTQCPKCHEAGKGVSADRCMACHEDVKEQVTSQSGFHKDKSQDCQRCHPDHKGRDFQLVKMSESDFDHTVTGFALEGPHQRAECIDCHEKPGEWTGLSQECTSCHDEIHKSDRAYMKACDDCHAVVDDWVVKSVPASVFDHTKTSQVDWILEGAHLDVACKECHIDAVFHPTDHGTCKTCHTNPHRMALSGGCETCHDTRSFHVSRFDHTLAGWPLEGQHATVPCRTCHGEHATRPLAHGTCADCHEDPHGGQFAPRACDTCHDLNVAAFQIARFDHEQTAFPLHGRHATVGCEECHGEGPGGRYAGLPAEDCDACHTDAHDGRFEPTPCKRCHVEEGWTVEDFDHDRTDFPLVGKHADVACEQCHPNDQWSDRPHASCEDCHADDDPHQHAFGPERCTECHQPTGWKERLFDHAAGTHFSLAPQHEEVACLDCHTSVTTFGGLGQECTGCHEDTRPFGHYKGTCETCHGGPAWIPADLGDVDHAVTGFPLEGIHSRLPCASCHEEGHPRAEANGECVGCHATDDVHRHQLGDACGDCHVPLTWTRTRFRHFSTGWPLRGAHRLVACESCHTVSYVATPRDCAPCHASQADLTVPAHRSAFFLDCEECHQPYTWSAPGYGH